MPQSMVLIPWFLDTAFQGSAFKEQVVFKNRKRPVGKLQDGSTAHDRVEFHGGQDDTDNRLVRAECTRAGSCPSLPHCFLSRRSLPQPRRYPVRREGQTRTRYLPVG